MLGFLIEQRVHGGVVNHTTEPTMNAKPTAFDAYLQRLPMILDKIEARRQLAVGHDPDAIHWGHVGNLGRVDQALDDLLAIFDGKAK
ncbi:MAG: hypothetical protein RBS14_00050 [Atribacterota bacterium]|jgi:hypothetical protein|nr:hypothetical protein [Atribacterota bacterium]